MELKDGDLNHSVSLKEEKQADNIYSSLHLSEVDRRHAANFTCEAKNKYLTRWRVIKVTVACETMFSLSFYLSPQSPI